MADNADVQGDEITLDDFDADEKQNSPKDSSPKDTKEVKTDKVEEKSEAQDTKDEVKADDTATPPDVPTKDEGEDAAETEVKPTKADERKSQLNGEIEESKKTLGIDPNTEIRDLVAARNALKTQVEKANAEVYQPATEDELVSDGMTTTDAKVESLRQRIEMRDYNDKVADAQLTLGSESERVLNDFPIFNPDAPEYDKELAEEAAALLTSNLVIDPNTNQIIGSNVSPYTLYKTLARASGISAVKGQMKGQQDTETQLANVDAASSAAPPQKPKDPLMELWSDGG